MQPVQAQMSSHKNYKMPFIICLSIAAVLIVILVIESILVLKNKQRKQKSEPYDCPCKAQLAGIDETPDETPDEGKGTTDASPDEIREDAAESYRRLLSYRK